MLKSRLMASFILLLALCLCVPVCAALLGASRSDGMQKDSEPLSVSTQSVEYAMELTDDAASLPVGSPLNSASATDAVQLPKPGYAEETTQSISADDPLVKEQQLLKEAEEGEAESGSAYDPDAFDLTKTIFPITAEEVEMLKYVIQAEAGGASLEDKRIVTFSITNRVLSPKFPDTIFEVLHARNQFSTISNYYSKNKVPNETTCQAVEDVLMGRCENNSQNCLYFYCTQYPVEQSVIDWFEEDLVYLYTIGCDRFFTDPS